MSDDHFLSRWSRRKAQAKSPASEPPPAAASPAPVVSVPAEPNVSEAAPLPLPPVESLTLDSDYAPFMQPGVDASLRRTALKTLLADPRFNVMDGLDVYIDDYSKPDPLPEGWLEKINAVARLGDYQPPQPESPAEEKLVQAQAVAPALPQDDGVNPQPNSPTREEPDSA
jgi:hypothetical protein